MHVCVPVSEENGLESVVYGHFGSAPFFMIVDTDTKEYTLIDKRGQEHAHGGCNPLANLAGHDIDAILVGGIGAGAINKLNTAGIHVHLASHGTVADNVMRFSNGQLPELTLQDGCQHHGGCGDH